MPQGAIQGVGSSYGDLVATQSVDATGAVTHTVFGDVAGTTADISYDPNGNLFTYWVHRAAGPWTSYVANAPTPNDPQNTLQGDLTNLFLQYDNVDNPQAINDGVGGSWPPGGQPVTMRTYGYGDDYRLRMYEASYGATAGDDAFTSPYTPKEARQFPAVSTPSTNARVRSQGFLYDWLGNTRATTDDANTFVDRSLGQVVNGSSSTGPNQLQGAFYAGGGPGLLAHYDAAGNMKDWEYGQGDVVSTGYRYYWDELGRLSYAIRDDASTGNAVLEGFSYTSSGQRVTTGRSMYEPATGWSVPTYSVQVYGSLKLEDSEYTFDYDTSTEQVYLGSSDGGTYAHVVYDAARALPTASIGTRDPKLHVFFMLADPLGSTSFVIDQATSEVVEHATYQPYGAVESDFRPTRWAAFREIVRHTGHDDDAEVGLIYFGARYYAPQLNRWISPDPLSIHSLGGTLNPYEFVSGSPAKYVDPFGLQEAGDEYGSGAPKDEPKANANQELIDRIAGSFFDDQEIAETDTTCETCAMVEGPVRVDLMGRRTEDVSEPESEESQSVAHSGANIVGGFAYGLFVGLVPGGGYADALVSRDSQLRTDPNAIQARAVGQILGGAVSVYLGFNMAQQGFSMTLGSGGAGALVGGGGAMLAGASQMANGGVAIAQGIALLAVARGPGAGAGGPGGGRREPGGEAAGGRGGGRTEPMTNREARQVATRLGFREVRASPVRSHGQLVFQQGNRYISPDVDVHSGGTWKMFDRDGMRLGTFNEDLSVRIGD